MSQITTHILDTSAGTPAAGVAVTLSRMTAQGHWTEVAVGSTNNDGRIPGLLSDENSLEPGTYRLHFATGDYFKQRNTACFHPFVEVVFELKDARHHHVPLLLNPFGYSTYRGS
ncbi:MAG: hydroxyisourate hydrolase [Bacteroidota bacterium]|jgi:5-hydroxyisourate hydrolase